MSERLRARKTSVSKKPESQTPPEKPAAWHAKAKQKLSRLHTKTKEFVNRVNKPRYSLKSLEVGDVSRPRLLWQRLTRKLPLERLHWRLLRRSLHSFGSHWAIILLAVAVIISGVMPRNFSTVAASADTPRRYRTVAQLASEDYFNEDVIYDEVIVTVGENSDYIFKTGATETVISKNNRTSTTIYEAKAGETVTSVARDFGLSVETVRYANNISGNSLSTGQKVKIPPVDGIYVAIQKNDTLLGIANKYKVQLSEIRKYNDLPEGQPIHAGNELLIPGVVQSKPTATSTTGSAGSKQNIGNVPQFLPKGGQFIWPTTSPTHFISQGYRSYHRAVDLNRLNGWSIHAAAAGTVKTYSMRGGYGNYIDIDHGNGFVTRYGHLSEFRVRTGDRVEQGQLLGIMGSTGRSTGPHLHFEIRLRDIPQNPLNYLPK